MLCKAHSIRTRKRKESNTFGVVLSTHARHSLTFMVIPECGIIMSTFIPEEIDGQLDLNQETTVKYGNHISRTFQSFNTVPQLNLLLWTSESALTL